VLVVPPCTRPERQPPGGAAHFGDQQVTDYS